MKRWYLLGPLSGYAYKFAKESHMICLQSQDDMNLGRRSTTSLHFGGVEFVGASEVAEFEKHASPTVVPLGHPHSSRGTALPQQAIEALAAYNVALGDDLLTALQKVIGMTKNWPMGLHEI